MELRLAYPNPISASDQAQGSDRNSCRKIVSSGRCAGVMAPGASDSIDGLRRTIAPSWGRHAKQVLHSRAPGPDKRAELARVPGISGHSRATTRPRRPSSEGRQKTVPQSWRQCRTGIARGVVGNRRHPTAGRKTMADAILTGLESRVSTLTSPRGA